MHRLFLLSTEPKNQAEYKQALIEKDKKFLVEETTFSTQKEWIDRVFNWSERYPPDYSVLEVNGSPKNSMIGTLRNQLSAINQYFNDLHSHSNS
jgi:hypothetical protein